MSKEADCAYCKLEASGGWHEYLHINEQLKSENQIFRRQLIRYEILLKDVVDTIDFYGSGIPFTRKLRAKIKSKMSIITGKNKFVKNKG